MSASDNINSNNNTGNSGDNSERGEGGYNENNEAAIIINNNRQFQDLPNDAISTILNHCTDLPTILNLSKTNPRMKEVIFEQEWKCNNCRGTIFASQDLDFPSVHCQPFFCNVCHNKYCGESINYDKRHCRRQICDGCNKIECHQCLQKHLEKSNVDGYGTENYCQDCQEEYDFGMGGC